MITVYQDGQAKVLRPCPLISISSNPIKNKMGNMGNSYTITLTGTILESEGSPFFTGSNSSVNEPLPTGKFSANLTTKPRSDLIDPKVKAAAILAKQNEIRSLFAVDGDKVEIQSWHGNEPVLVFYPKVESINFEEGVYIDLCRYTITLTADILFDKSSKIISDSLAYLNFEPTGVNSQSMYSDAYRDSTTPVLLQAFMDKNGGFVEDFSETWSLEPEEGTGMTVSPFVSPAINTIRGYRLTRNISATGRTIYGPGSSNNSVRYEAWQQAKEFVRVKLLADKDNVPANNSNSAYDQYPKLNFEGEFARNFINLSQNKFGGYNHARTENIDKTNGTYSINDTWLLSSGTSYENYSASLTSSNDNGKVSVSIDGTIRGLTSLPASGHIYGGSFSNTNLNSPYDNAILKYREVSNNGTFGLTSHIYKRASNLVGLFLNPIPLSTNLSSNEFTGEITYNVSFDTRPLNFISGVLSENISIQDTYPGDVFATIPVIGRKTGPILQYLGTRTEYLRSVNIDIVVDTNYGGNSRQQILLSKPSLNEPMRTSLNNLISYLSPSREPNIRKYFLNPPTESWDPKEKRYSINLNWTYELNN